MRDLNDVEQALAFRFSYLPLPDDAVDCDPWASHGDDDWRRFFLTREWEVDGLWVSVAGEQKHHGEVRRWLHVGGDDECTTSDRHHLIDALVAAGQLLDSLTQLPPKRISGGGPKSSREAASLKRWPTDAH